MTDTQRQSEQRANKEWAHKIIERNIAKAESMRYTLPWTDPHFINILRRVYRNYLMRRN